MGIFSPPSQPYVPPFEPPPSPPTPVDQASLNAAEQAKARLAAASGYASTVKTGGQGVTTPANTAMKTLLGQ